MGNALCLPNNGHKDALVGPLSCHNFLHVPKTSNVIVSLGGLKLLRDAFHDLGLFIWCFAEENKIISKEDMGNSTSSTSKLDTLPVSLFYFGMN